MQHALEVVGLCKSFKDGFWLKQRQVLKNVGFTVRAGVTTGFVGSNGSGKTTTLKCVLGFLFADQGTCKVHGSLQLNNSTKMQLGYLPERPYYYDFLSAQEFLQFHWRLSGGGAGFAQACDQVLAKVNLTAAKQKRLRSFSKGMLQRIGMAQALLRKPRFLILDEPMSGLDPDGRFLMKEILREEQKSGTTIFFSSHLLGDMEELCQDVVVIDQGEILYQGALAPLALNHEGDYRIAYFDSAAGVLKEKTAHRDSLQDALDELRKAGQQIVRVGQNQAGLELGFAKLVEQKRGLR